MAQDKGFYLGSNLSMIYEQRSARIYGSGYEERTSKTANIGLGVRAIYKTKKAKFGSGLSYVNRNYKMTRPFDHCLFNKPGDLCLKYLGYVDQYNYQTIEIPLTFDLTLYKINRIEYFIGATYTNAFYFKSNYHTYLPDLGTLSSTANFHAFSKSIFGQISISYSLKKKLLVNLQPFVRINCKQRSDIILFEQNPVWIETWWDSFGINAELLYKFAKLN